jgi:hypothetical protein
MIEIRKRERLCTLRKGKRWITLERRGVPAVGEELIPSAEHGIRIQTFRNHICAQPRPKNNSEASQEPQAFGRLERVKLTNWPRALDARGDSGIRGA